MDARSLGHFLAVVDHGGFARGAAARHITQSALSQAIRRLEDECGTPLFHRTGHRVVLSDSGRALLAPARDVLLRLQHAQEAVRAVQGLRHGRLDVAAPPALSVSPLAGMIQRFRACHAGVRVRMHACTTSDRAREAVAAGHAEFAFVNRRGGADDLAVIALAETEMVVLVPPGVTLDRSVRHRIEALQHLPFIVGARHTRAHDLIEKALEQGIALQIAVETPHREALVSLVVEGVGAAFVPEAFGHMAVRQGAQMLRLDPAPTYQTYLLHRAGGLTPAAQAFLAVNNIASAHAR